MLTHGTTTIEAKSGYSLEIKGELNMLQASAEMERKLGVDMVPTFLGAHTVSPEFENAKDYTNHIFEDMLPAVPDAGIARYCNVFCEKGILDVAQSKRTILAVKKLGFGLKGSRGRSRPARLGEASCRGRGRLRGPHDSHTEEGLRAAGAEGHY